MNKPVERSGRSRGSSPGSHIQCGLARLRGHAPDVYGIASYLRLDHALPIEVEGGVQGAGRQGHVMQYSATTNPHLYARKLHLAPRQHSEMQCEAGISGLRRGLGAALYQRARRGGGGGMAAAVSPATGLPRLAVARRRPARMGPICPIDAAPKQAGPTIKATAHLFRRRCCR